MVEQADMANPMPDPTQPGGPRPKVAELFKTKEVVELLGLSRRQLQYWAKTGLIEPSAQTPGGHHRYSFDDLVALKATKRLLDAGVSVQKIRKSVSALRTLLPRVGRPLAQKVLVATGDVVLVFHEDTVFEAVSGQEWVFEVADFEREVAAFCQDGCQHGVQQQANRPSAANADGAERDALPEKPGPRSTTRPVSKDWSQTG